MPAISQVSDRLRSVDLLVGAGGLALGAARAGFDSLAVVDSDKQSCETLRCQRDGAALVESGARIEGAVVRGKYRILSKLG